jgi:hypothetical protein
MATANKHKVDGCFLPPVMTLPLFYHGNREWADFRCTFPSLLFPNGFPWLYMVVYHFTPIRYVASHDETHDLLAAVPYLPSPEPLSETWISIVVFGGGQTWK